MDDLHRPPAQYIARTHYQRIANLVGSGESGLGIARGAVGWLLQPKLLQHFLKAFSILSTIYHVRTGPDDGHPVCGKISRKLQRCLAAILYDHAKRFLYRDDLKYILQRQRFKI